MLVKILLASMAFSARAQSSLTIVPATLTRCNGHSLATARLTWTTAESAVQVRIGTAAGPAMSGFEPGIGGATTGDWVADGLVFVLVNPNGQEVARAVANVRCLAASPNLAAQLATQSYFPLEVGNRWIYRYSDRNVTAVPLVRWVDRTVVAGGETWYALRQQTGPGASFSESLYRIDDAGRIHQQANNRIDLFLDPNPNPDPKALAVVEQRNFTVSTAFGSIPNAISYVASTLFTRERGTFARGIGLLSNDRRITTGSNGGFSDGVELVEAVIAGQIRFRSPSNGLELAPESQVLDLAGRQVRNCAVPCYSASCGLGGSQPDPPGTYKPCLFTRLKVENPAAKSLLLELLNPANDSVYSVNRPLEPSANEQLWFETVPLYRAPSVVLPPGQYQLKATVKSEAGATLNTSLAALRID